MLKKFSSVDNCEEMSIVQKRRPRCQLRKLVLDVLSLVLTATDTAFCNTLIFLELAESRIHHAALVVIRPRTLLISFFAVQLRSLCTARYIAILSLRSLVQAQVSCPASGAPWSSVKPSFLKSGRAAPTKTRICSTTCEII